MFNLRKLTINSINDQSFDYEFVEGINYFVGKNNSGKTEFYLFLDYMFGSSDLINNKEWFKYSLSSAILSFSYNGISYDLKRTLNKENNFFRYSDEEWSDKISLSEYRNKLNSIFSFNMEGLKELREFAEEDLSFRTFTLFNFLGEKSLGETTDFFTKCREIKYSAKLPVILNYIFNANLKKIFDLKKELDKLTIEVSKIDRALQKFSFMKENVNNNLKKLNISIEYTGTNKEKILTQIQTIKNLETIKKSNKKVETISNLEILYNNIDEQIKKFENTINDSKEFERESKNRKKILNKFNTLIFNNQEYEYLIAPLIDLTNNLDRNISFNNYIIENNTIKELKKQKKIISKKIKENEYKFTMFDIESKSRSIALIEEYLRYNTNYTEEELQEKRKRIKEIRNEIRVLQNNDNVEKLESLSKLITNLYSAAFKVSDIVLNDTSKHGFFINYHKKGNFLQPQIFNSSEKNEYANYYTGSMARHTLIQLCGYLAFLKLLVFEKRYPLIPILVIDHISKPFDDTNKRAIGAIFNKFYETVSTKEVQVFIFDDESHEKLSIIPHKIQNLTSESKTGFNPFYSVL